MSSRQKTVTYPLIIAEPEGDGFHVWLNENSDEALAFLDEFSDCLEEFLAWDGQGRRLTFDCDSIRIRGVSEDCIKPSDDPTPKELLLVISRIAPAAATKHFDSLDRAIDFLRMRTRVR